MIGGEVFEFDEDSHTYTLGGRKMLGVSEIIQSAGLKDFSRIPPDVLAHACARGRAVHAACEFFDQNDLDWDTVSDEIKPYVVAWQRFKSDCPIEWADIEKPLYHATFGFAGTPDRIAVAPGRAVYDIKTYAPDAVTGVQLAAYSLLRFGPQPSFDEPKRVAVWLKKDGKYRVTEYSDRGDESVFMACLTVCKFKGGNK